MDPSWVFTTEIYPFLPWIHHGFRAASSPSRREKRTSKKRQAWKQRAAGGPWVKAIGWFSRHGWVVGLEGHEDFLRGELLLLLLLLLL